MAAVPGLEVRISEEPRCTTEWRTIEDTRRITTDGLNWVFKGGPGKRCDYFSSLFIRNNLSTPIVVNCLSRSYRII